MAIVDYVSMTECLSTDGLPNRPDGWILKHTDTGDMYHRVLGSWELMGLGYSFAPPTKSGSVISDNDGEAEVIFASPFIDDQYTVALTCTDEGIGPVVALFTSKTPNGFTLVTVSHPNKRERDVTVSWLATRNHNR